MRRIAYALAASVALMFGALTQASASCYGGDCYGYRDNGYYGGERTYYEGSRYYDSGSRGTTVYYERGPEIQTGYYERPLYRGGYGADYNGDGYSDSGYGYRGYSNGYGYGNGYGYRGNGYGYRDYGYRDYGYRDYGYRGGYGYRGYGYRGYGGGHGYGYGYRPYYAPTVYSGGALLQTAGALGYGGYGCNSAYVPYGWSWYRATSC